MLNLLVFIIILAVAIILPIGAYFRDRTNILLVEERTQEDFTNESEAQTKEMRQVSTAASLNDGEPKPKTFWAIILSLLALLSFALIQIFWSLPPVDAIYVAMTAAVIILLIEVGYISGGSSGSNKLYVVAGILTGIAVICFVIATALFHMQADDAATTDPSGEDTTSTTTTTTPRDRGSLWDQITEGIGEEH